MKEEYISFDTAKLAKEKGANLPHSHYYVLDYSTFKSDGILKQNSNPDGTNDNFLQIVKLRKGQPHIAAAYSQSVLQRWLREVHNIDVIVYPIEFHKTNGITEQTENIEYNFYLYKNVIKLDVWGVPSFKSYEEALENGLSAGLNLIKI